MPTTIRLDQQIEDKAKIASITSRRTVTGQVLYWADIGRIAEAYPDLPYNAIKGILEGLAEIDEGLDAPRES